MPLPNRASNASKINTHYLYTQPYRYALPTLDFLLFVLSAVVVGFSLESFVIHGRLYPEEVNRISQGTFFAIYTLIPLLLLIWHSISLARRYFRLTSAIEATISSSIVTALWMLYMLLFLVDAEFDFINVIWGAPGVLLGVLYVGFAGDTLRRQRRDVKGMPKGLGMEGGGVELGVQRAQPPAYSRGSRPTLGRRGTSQEALTVVSQPAKQKWSPL